MGDDHTSDAPTPETRAPWERPLADQHYREAQSGRQRRLPPRQPPPELHTPERPAPSDRRSPIEHSDASRHDSGRAGRRAAGGPTEGLSVADLVKKVAGDEPGRQDDPDKTETIPPVDERHPPPGAVPPRKPTFTPSPSEPPTGDADTGWHADAETTATPQVVGNPALTRLALSKSRRRRRLRAAGRGFVALVAVIALAGTGIVWGYLRSTEGKFDQIAALDTESTDIVDAGGQTGDETYLIVGTDTRAGASGAIGAGTVDDAEGSRADTVMLVNIPADRSRVVAVSFPRDLDVERPVCQGWDNDTGTYSEETFPSAEGDKLNATYALGGPKCLVKVIQKLSGLKIGHFVGMDFAGFESMVNEIGGVKICTTQPLEDYVLGTVLPQAGTQVLDGKTALNFVRARHVEAEGNGDYGRINRQQRFLSALLRGALSSQVLLNPGKLNGFINAFTRDTFVENIDTKSLVTLGRSLQNVDAGAVTFLTVPTAGTTEWGNEIPRTDDIKAIFRAIIDDAPLPGEKRAEPIEAAASAPTPTPSAPLSVSAVDPASVSVQVSNASGESGLAATTADALAAQGFQIYNVGNYTATSAETVVRFSPGHEAEAATLASAFPGAILESTSGLGTVAEVAIGSNFSGAVDVPSAIDTPLDMSRVRVGQPEDVEIPADLAVVNAGDASCD
ncbi:LCP family protein [Rhodococcus tibetensis]|uniref:LCP family protein n=1 Tax=Rhodococcus tibetensis TaxID=2965064 RepID=A0ABT1Q6M8_9NOCA|nr:LCP family protein [Rhodococcus sp. FXJ9.536]MCQ4117909.1 LCP family protein [Rhodococcus sp. FXJ9.536]